MSNTALCLVEVTVAHTTETKTRWKSKLIELSLYSLKLASTDFHLVFGIHNPATIYDTFETLELQGQIGVKAVTAPKFQNSWSPMEAFCADRWCRNGP